MNRPGVLLSLRYSLVACLLWLIVSPKEALADVVQCIEGHSQGQVLRDEGRMKEAKASLHACLSTDCPAPIREECQRFVDDLNRRLPSFVVAARDEAGADIVGVTVSLDGAPLPGALDMVHTVEPGRHLFLFKHPDGREVEMRVIAQETVKSRPVVAVFEDSSAEMLRIAPNQPRTEESADLTLPLVLAGVGVASLTGFAILASRGSADEEHLRTTCAPNCTDEQRDDVASKYLWADVLLAVGGLSLAGGAYVYFTPAVASGGDRAGVTVGYRGVF